MLWSIFILTFSMAALAYWARLSCLQVLREHRGAEEAARVAEANRLEFQRVREQLAQADPSAYDGLQEALRHDFLALTYLLRYAATLHVGRYTGQERLLVVDFHAMRAMYHLSRPFSPRASRYALQEMSDILEYFAGVMGHRMSAFSARMNEA